MRATINRLLWLIAIWAASVASLFVVAVLLHLIVRITNTGW
jgi:Protein of unknown function (DUF2474)